MLIITCGVQGLGKSIVANYIAKKTNSILLRADIIRKEVLENPAHTPEERQMIYGLIFERTALLLKKGKNVIIDGTFAEDKNRQIARNLAKSQNADFKLVEVVCNEEVAKNRINERWRKNQSEAPYGKHLEYKKKFEPIIEDHTIIDNSGKQEETYKQIDKFF